MFVDHTRRSTVVVCDLESSRIGAPYIYDISSLRVKSYLNNRKQRVNLEVKKHTVTLLVGKLLRVAFRRVLHWVLWCLIYIHSFIH